MQLFWDLDGDKLADTSYTCSNGDTLTARLYISNTDTSNIVASKPIMVFGIQVMYGYYTRWSSNPNYNNILTLDSVVFDSTALGLVMDSIGVATDTLGVPIDTFYSVIDTNGVFTYANNANLRRFNITYYDTTDHAIIADSCIGTFTFIVSGVGKQLLHFNYLGNEDNYNMEYNTAVLNNRYVNYSLWVKDCKIIAQ